MVQASVVQEEGERTGAGSLVLDVVLHNYSEDMEALKAAITHVEGLEAKLKALEAASLEKDSQIRRLSIKPNAM